MTQFKKAIDFDYLDLLKEELKYDEKTNTHFRLSQDSWTGVMENLFEQQSIECIKFFVEQNYDFSDHDKILSAIIKARRNMVSPDFIEKNLALLEYAIREFKIDLNKHALTTTRYGRVFLSTRLSQVLEFPEIVKAYLNHGADVMLPVILNDKAMESVDCDLYLQSKIVIFKYDGKPQATLDELMKSHSIIKEHKKSIMEKNEISQIIPLVEANIMDKIQTVYRPGNKI